MLTAGMLPHRGYGEAMAHQMLSTGIMQATIAFHDDVGVTDWPLYADRAFWSGRGVVQGQGPGVHPDGRLAALYTVQAMVRDFARDPAAMGHDSSTAM